MKQTNHSSRLSPSAKLDARRSFICREISSLNNDLMTSRKDALKDIIEAIAMPQGELINFASVASIAKDQSIKEASAKLLSLSYLSSKSIDEVSTSQLISDLSEKREILKARISNGQIEDGSTAMTTYEETIAFIDKILSRDNLI